jgi:aspartate carbamoyltransferase
MSHISSQHIVPIGGSFVGKDIVSLEQFSPRDLQTVFDLADQMKQVVLNNQPSQVLSGLLVALLFLEPSSRTFGSFSAAVKRLGGQTIEIQNPQGTSLSKGETLEDTIQVFESYTNAIVLRHPRAGAVLQAAEAARFVPVINAGDGNNEHPTQTLLDLYTIYEKFGRLDNLVGLLAGDVLNSRTIHSLMRGLAFFPNNTVYLLSPERLRLKRDVLARLREGGLTIYEISNEKDIPKASHFWYWTRVQKERFESLAEYEGVVRQIVVATPQLLDNYAGKETIVLDPLPRVNSVDPAIDADERCVFLRSQVRNGVYTRMALLALVLGRA